VVLVARGEHGARMAADGLVLESPGSTDVLRLPVAGAPADVDWSRPAVVVLGVKSQDTDAALDALAARAPPETPVACAQNGVEGERRVLRRFAHTYAVCVMLPATHLRPGLVQAHGAPRTGILDVGRYPSGVDDTALELAAAFSGSNFTSVARPDVMRWKYTKLLMNLGNVVNALCGYEGFAGPLVDLARDEGRRVLDAAGIDFASADEDAARRAGHFTVHPTESGPHRGGSTWQSAVRGTSLEVDYLNGEISLLGGVVGVPTPVNRRLQQLARQLVADPSLVGRCDPDELLAQLTGSTV